MPGRDKLSEHPGPPQGVRATCSLFSACLRLAKVQPSTSCHGPDFDALKQIGFGAFGDEGIALRLRN